MAHFNIQTIITGTFISAFALSSAVLSAPFTDIEKSAWKTPIKYLYEKNIIGGYPDGTFRPDIYINRAEFLKIVAESSGDAIGSAVQCGFPDVPSGEWFAKYACHGKNKGHIQGYPDGTFKPLKNISLVEALKIIEKTFGWNVEDGKEVWYQPYYEKAQEKKLIPDTLKKPGQLVTRGEMAEMIMQFLTDKEKSTSKLSFDDERLAKLPACTEQKLTTPFVNLHEVYEITPLGNLGPPGHTFPTEHMYFHISAGNTTERMIDLVAPADLYLLNVSSTINKKENTEDHSMTLALCKDVFIYFNHVKKLSDEMNEHIKETDCTKFGTDPYQDNPDIDFCVKDVFAQIKNNTKLGKVGHLQGNFDFGAYDYRSKNAFINPARYGIDKGDLFRPRSLYITCPIDLYDEKQSPNFYAKIKRTQLPQCGEVMQDIPGTAHGNWFYDDTANADARTDWKKSLALVKDNENPLQEVISLGGIAAEPLRWQFAPTRAGTVNKAFEDIRPGQTLYCYEQAGKTERIMLQLVDENTLKFEHQKKLCNEAYTLEKPFTYKR